MTVEHLDIVQQLYQEAPAERTLEGALAFTLRVIERLNRQFPDERAGLLIKKAGENILVFDSTSVSVARICYPNQKLYKVLSDVPATNGPQWLDDGFAQVGGYVGGYLRVGEASEPDRSQVGTRPAGDVSEAIAELGRRMSRVEDTLRKLLDRRPPNYVGDTSLGKVTLRPDAS
jgi:hypothetical protein